MQHAQFFYGGEEQGIEYRERQAKSSVLRVDLLEGYVLAHIVGYQTREGVSIPEILPHGSRATSQKLPIFSGKASKSTQGFEASIYHLAIVESILAFLDLLRCSIYAKRSSIRTM